MTKAILQNRNHEIEIKPQESLLEALLRQGIEIDHSCGGMGSCGTCRVQVTEGLGDLPSRNRVEAEMAEDRGFTDDERLSCQLLPRCPFSFRTP